MKVLYLTGAGDDFMASCLWDGLQEVLGEQNVFDARGCPALHSGRGGPCGRISDSWPGKYFDVSMPRDFDLLVVIGSFVTDTDWHWPHQLRLWLRPDAKTVHVDGWDHVSETHVFKSDPPLPIDVFFRREIEPGLAYPYECQPMLFSAPTRWFTNGDNNNRVYDVFCAMHHGSNDVRWPCLQQVWQTVEKHVSITASGSISVDTYFHYLRNSKLCICPPGGGSDCMRQWEAIASGCIPIFVGHPSRVRSPWFADDEIFWVDNVGRLAATIDIALTSDLDAMRKRLRRRAMVEHTTAARARQLLSAVGMSA